SVYGLALISVGGLIFSSNLAELNWKEVEIGFSAFVTIVLIILTYSLTNGIGFGLLTYIVISLARGKGKQINWILYLITGFYILSFVINEIL
ncbi:MAG: NCS2 family permease, partial [Mollicutes bacterium]|nr:NCS2 family permease [Mollicutes bacterium]